MSDDEKDPEITEEGGLVSMRFVNDEGVDSCMSVKVDHENDTADLAYLELEGNMDAMFETMPLKELMEDLFEEEL